MLWVREQVQDYAETYHHLQIRYRHPCYFHLQLQQLHYRQTCTMLDTLLLWAEM